MNCVCDSKAEMREAQSSLVWLDRDIRQTEEKIGELIGMKSMILLNQIQ
jgi:hypothetical protein